MAAAEGPLLHRRRLGAELRRLRGDRTLDEVADATLISTSKLSRLENGQGVPQPRDIRDLVAYYGLGTADADRLRRWASAGRSQAWWRDSTPAMQTDWDTYLEYESGASIIRSYASAVVPPLLQTERYATQLLLPRIRSEEAVRRLVDVLARRQQLLVHSPDGPSLIVLLDEAVLRRTIGDAVVMRAQLEHLTVTSRQRNVSLLVVPLDAGAHAGLPGPFTILQYADDRDRDIVSVESHTSERLLEQPADVLEYIRIFDAINRLALDNDETRAFIARVRSTLDSPEEDT